MDFSWQANEENTLGLIKSIFRMCILHVAQYKQNTSVPQYKQQFRLAERHAIIYECKTVVWGN